LTLLNAFDAIDKTAMGYSRHGYNLREPNTSVVYDSDPLADYHDMLEGEGGDVWRDVEGKEGDHAAAMEITNPKMLRSHYRSDKRTKCPGVGTENHQVLRKAGGYTDLHKVRYQTLAT
jgi:hypothetical protein